VHPRTRQLIAKLGLTAPDSLELWEPVSYLAMLGLIENAELMLTDSGGIQKEAFWLETPCVTVRATTEWPETIEARANVLAEAETQAIIAACLQMRASRIDTSLKPYGDGRASEVIAGKLKESCE
jgi:UDP-GlcNAc3NAcA epimerase